MKAICEYVITVKNEVCTPEMCKYGFERGNARLFYVSKIISDDSTVKFTCPNYNGVTKEDISPTFEVLKKYVVDISKIDDKYYKIPNDNRNVDEG